MVKVKFRTEDDLEISELVKITQPNKFCLSSRQGYNGQEIVLPFGPIWFKYITANALSLGCVVMEGRTEGDMS